MKQIQIVVSAETAGLPVMQARRPLGHGLEAHSFPRATLSENCSLLGTDNVRGQISWHIFAPNGGYCLFTIHQIFSFARDWSQHVAQLNIPQLKLENIREYSPIF